MKYQLSIVASFRKEIAIEADSQAEALKEFWSCNQQYEDLSEWELVQMDHAEVDWEMEQAVPAVQAAP